MTYSFKEIKAWQYAHTFVLQVYYITKRFPEYEKFGLCSQFQRAAVSIPANIAEGYKKLSKADKLRYMNIAQGSLEESRYYIILSKDLGYIDNSMYVELESLVEKTSWFLNAYCKSIVNDNALKQQ